jgi:hypothetical protein
MSYRPNRRKLIAVPAIAILVLAAVTAVVLAATASTTRLPYTPAPGEQLTWRAVGSPPLSDAEAAARVAAHPDSGPENAQANDFVPSEAELAAFHEAEKHTGWVYSRYVTGRPGISDPSTDDLIQWAAAKWGIPAQLLRALCYGESGWEQAHVTDNRKVSKAWYRLYPPQARIAGSNEEEVYESMGITSLKWEPEGSQPPGTEPLRWKSTAFNLDFLGSQLRYYYDGLATWVGKGYRAGQAWDSVGAWFEPTPWGGSEQRWYIKYLKRIERERPWLSPNF